MQVCYTEDLCVTSQVERYQIANNTYYLVTMNFLVSIQSEVPALSRYTPG